MPPKRKRGMSLEEKRAVILKMMQECCESFDIKELESQGSKLGVVQKTIKDVVQSLVDDGHVEKDKVGAKNIFWSFPSSSFLKKKLALKDAQNRLAEGEGAIATIAVTREELLRYRTPSEERSFKLEKLDRLTAENAQMKGDLVVLAKNDPAQFEQLQEEVGKLKEAVNRWTDNTFAIKDYTMKKFGTPSEQIDAQMHLSEDFDYVE